MRMIDADELIPLIKMGEMNTYDEYGQGRNGGIAFAIERINQMPTIEPVTVTMDEALLAKATVHQQKAKARKKGKWRKMPMACYGGGTITEYECSVCAEHQIVTSRYCPNCGAYMQGDM